MSQHMLQINSPISTVGSGEDPLVGDEGASAEVSVVDEEGHLVRPRVGHRLSAPYDARWTRAEDYCKSLNTSVL